MKGVIAAFAFLASIQAFSDDSIFMNFASCKGTIDHVEVGLEFFEELDSGSGEKTGKGHVVQRMNFGESRSLNYMNKINVVGDEKKKTVQMFATLEPSVLFSTFELDFSEIGDESIEVEIFAENFGKVWGTFECVNQSIQETNVTSDNEIREDVDTEVDETSDESGLGPEYQK